MTDMLKYNQLRGMGVSHHYAVALAGGPGSELLPSYVAAYDTGWRDITALFTTRNPQGPLVVVKRDAMDVVHCVADPNFAYDPAVIDAANVELPHGFWPISHRQGFLVYSDDVTPAGSVVIADGIVSTRTIDTSDSPITVGYASGGGSWPSVEARPDPDDLPGVAYTFPA